MRIRLRKIEPELSRGDVAFLLRHLRRVARSPQMPTIAAWAYRDAACMVRDYIVASRALVAERRRRCIAQAVRASAPNSQSSRNGG